MNRTEANTTAGYKVLAFSFLAAVALAVAVAALAFTAPAFSAGPAKTTLTIRAQGTDLSGAVGSQRLRCLGNRTVKLFKQQGRKQNPSADILVATDTSERRGRIGVWSTGNTGMTGRFYVRTAKTPICTAAVSRTVRATR